MERGADHNIFMKVLNLCCSNAHRFEGWFGSEPDFRAQSDSGLVTCPICDDKTITRLPSAPRLNVSKQRDVGSAPRGPAEVAPGDQQTEAQGRWLRAMRHILSNTEDVGDRFPEEARRIHYGETANRGIRGQATREDADALSEEGIDVVSVSLPAPLKGPLQ